MLKCIFFTKVKVKGQYPFNEPLAVCNMHKRPTFHQNLKLEL